MAAGTVRSDHPFYGRSLAVIDDFNPAERLFLYQTAREVKSALVRSDRAALDSFRVADPDFGMYEIFLEDSTRTRESFKNAAHFHRLKFSELNAQSSSFNKSESYADTFANLIGYENRIFVVRTRLEGVCRHLEERIPAYLRRHGVPFPVSFVNAGDGRHEHPTQELLDEFTFLEDLNWSTERIHLALVGDLYHGRTVHSKVRGLGLFQEVHVDLVAPPELSMPNHYVSRMRDQGFRVRVFGSIEEYLETHDVAAQWYFTRPQLERMGERVLSRAATLRAAITFRPELIDRLPTDARFYHPLPRHREHPTIPTSLDDTTLNGWERQSANGWIVRITLLALLAGKVGADYGGPVGPQRRPERPFVTESKGGRSTRKRYSEGIRPITDGIVLDHISVGDRPEEIRSHLTTLISVMQLHGPGGEWVSTGSDGRRKGLVFRPGHPPLTDSEINKLAAVVPGATVNVIRGGEVTRKVRLGYPDTIYGIAQLRCHNEACITHPTNGENVLARFHRLDDDSYDCAYCSQTHQFTEVWR